MEKIYETHLSEPCKEWLKMKGCQVAGEVKSIDLMGVFEHEGESLTIAIELKLKLNLDLILQAVERQKLVDYVYIAIPHEYKVLESGKFKKIQLLLRRLNVGLLTVNFRSTNPYVSEIIEAKPYDFQKSRRNAEKKKNALLKEFHSRITDSNDGGLTRRKIMTAYREQALLIAYHLSKNEIMSIKALKELGCSPKSGIILRADHYGWFEKSSQGNYKITQAGIDAVNGHQDILQKIIDFTEAL